MRGLFGRLTVTAAVALLAALSLAPAAAYHEEGQPGDEGAHEFADPAFQDRWARTDMPVAENQVDRTWIWGPEPYTGGMQEPYEDSPGGQRLVQYFDKSRMEINDPNAPGESLWNVTNGLLVVEMVEGRYQVGDTEFDNSPEPAEIPIAGDPDAQFGPTYADISRLNLRDADSRPTGTTITEAITDQGEVESNEHYAEYDVTAEHNVQVPGIDHTVAGPFWDFMNSNGIVYENGEYVTDDLFRNPFYATGYPITEAYWSTVEVADEQRDVLWQCFERRCLTYTPGNPEGFVVEAGNVGQHYYRWRYGDDQQQTQTVELHFVAVGDAGQSGMLIGCDDSLVPVETQIPATDNTEQKITATMEQLLAVDEQQYGESGLYNALYQSDLMVENVTVENGTATVNLTGNFSIGGTCDEPRVEYQLRETVLQFEEITDAQITINGQTLEELFGAPQQGTQTVNLYFVGLEGGGEGGMEIGCGDSLIPVQTEVNATDDTASKIEAALSELFGIDQQEYGEDNLYNALYQSNLMVDNVTVQNGTATVSLSGEYAVGGVCDEPRFVQQIRQTVLQFDNVDSADITVNGQTLDELFGGQGN